MPPISTFDSPELLGALEIGAFVSIFMFGTVTMQGHVYYQNCQNEPKWRTYFIALILLLELGHTIVTAQSVWWATITIADMVIKPGNGYATAACTLYSSVITFLVKAYYINSIRVLSSKLWLSILGWILTVIDFGTSLVVSYEAFMDVPREPNNFSFEREWRWLITSGLALGALVDVLIAAAMVYHLRQLSPMLDLQMKSAAKMLNRLLIWTIETGLMTSVVSITVVVCFHIMEFNYIWFAVYLPLAKLYSNSLLVSLNARPARRQQFGLVQVPPRSQSSGNLHGFQSSLNHGENSVSQVSGISTIRRSTIGSSCVRVNSVISARSNFRRSTVGSANTRLGKEFSNVDFHSPHGYPRQKINSLLDISGKKWPRDQYIFSSTTMGHRVLP